MDDLAAVTIDGDCCADLLAAAEVAAEDVGHLPVTLVDVSTDPIGEVFTFRTILLRRLRDRE